MPRRSRKRLFTRRVITEKYLHSEGFPQLLENLAVIRSFVDDDDVIDLLMDEGAQPLRDEARRNAPYDPKRKKGVHLRDAIFASEGDVNRDPRGPTVLAGVNTNWRKGGAPHAHLIERGTFKMRSRPFWRPSVVKLRPVIAGAYAAGLRQLMTVALRVAGRT